MSLVLLFNAPRALVQKFTGQAFSGTTVTAAFASSNTLGNTIVVCSQSFATSVADSQGNTYSPTTFSGIWYALNCKAGANTVTVTFTGAQTFMEVIAQEYTAASSGGGLDQNTYATGTSAAPTGGAITTTVKCLVVGWVSSGQSPTAGTGFTLVENVTGDGVEYQVQNAAGAVTAAMVQGTSATWYFFTATFKPPGTAWTSSATDTFSFAEVATKSFARAIAEALTLADVVLKKPGKFATDAITLAESGAKSVTRSAVSDAFTLAETILKKPAKLCSDAFTLAEATLRTPAKLVADSITLAEAIAKSVVRSAVAEAFTLADVILKAPGKLAAEAFTLAEALTRFLTRGSVSDSITLADVVVKTPGKLASDSFSLVDNGLTRAVSKLTSDVVTLAENAVRAVSRGFTDALTLVDVTLTTIKARLVFLSDAFTISDSFTRSISRQVVDAIALAESASKSVARSLIDALTLADYAPVRAVAHVVSDAIALTEAAIRTTTRSFADALTLAETFAKNAGRTAIEVFTVIERGTSRAVSRTLSDAFSPLDALGRALSKQFVDVFTLADSGVAKLLSFFPARFVAQLAQRLWGATVNLRVFTARSATRSWTAEQVSRVRVAQARIRLWSANETMIYADPKDPESIEDFQIDWTTVLGTDTISTSVWEVPSDLTIVVQTHTTLVATVRLSGGVAGQRYPVKNVVTLASGRVLPQPMLIPVDV